MMGGVPAAGAMHGRVLVVAGSDSGGGAGIQADIKAITALGGFAMTAVTALTAQNTTGVFGIHPVPAAFVAEQIQVVLDDLGADCVKLGMLHSRELIETVAGMLETAGLPVVVDPVMVAKGGAPLLQPDAVEVLRQRILPLAAVVTPNLPEAALLTSLPADSEAQRIRIGHRLIELGAKSALIKGGHDDGAEVVDLLITPDDVVRYQDPRQITRHSHGTGCTLASAIAAGLAQGLDLEAAVRRARRYVQAALRTAPGYGRGHGPLNHAVTVQPLPEP